ncbi:hypothetical protein CVT25_014586 [Psilocybe cyanescens]|uniref:Uncharacterized protein n=1 Tax=Psilocybe cyanescens TaxID=93625 RepID=A0A409XRP9_PSICY|nr:hypothetical protein CVT25_014586 [Psilocybe cyanescens]
MAGGTADEFGFKAKKKAEVDATPVKKARACPLSGQMLSKSTSHQSFSSRIVGTVIFHEIIVTEGVIMTRLTWVYHH